MNKKKLPKAIRPANTGGARPASGATETLRHDPDDMAETTMEMEAAAADATEMTPGRRHAMAVKLVERFSLWSGVAGLLPVPIVDLAAVSGVQIQMLRRISQIYGVPFAENRGKSIIAGLAGSMIPASSAMGTASLMKGVPLVGTLISAIAMPALSAGATYAIGMTFIEHFASGGTLLDFSAGDYREFINAQKVMWSSRSKPRRAAKSGPASQPPAP
jgi:uncharacterized protein (DUF697 family)